MDPPGPLDATAATLFGVMLGQLPIAVLGVLLITGEYSTGSIRSSLAAVSARLRLLAAKAVVIARRPGAGGSPGVVWRGSIR